MARILLIDDDDDTFVVTQIRQALPGADHEVTAVPAGADGVARVRASPPDIILLDPTRFDSSGLTVHEHIRMIDPRIPVILVTSATSANGAIEAMRQGAFDYLRKPLDAQQLRKALAEALTVAEQGRLDAVAVESPEEAGHDAFIGCSKGMLDVCKAIGRVSAQDVPVLVTGESGTGKEVAARALHRHSARASAPFLALNCAAIPESLLESELFGHERGAFTGADRRSIGKFEQCSGGTILLDEIGDMPLPLQAKILRLLQEQVFQRVGGNETVRTDVRVIAATHRDLRSLVAQGKLRADLFYRLAVCTIELPPLRERSDDLPILARHFVTRYSCEFGMKVRDIAADAMAQLRAYDWPGNVRELQSVLKQALLRARGTVLLRAFLPDLSSGERAATSTTSRLDLDGLIRRHLGPDIDDLYEVTHREVDRLLFARVLLYTNGNQRRAARLLGISPQTMRGKFRALALRLTHAVAANEAVGIN